MVGQKSILPYEPWDQRNYLWVEGNLTPIYQNLEKGQKKWINLYEAKCGLLTKKKIGMDNKLEKLRLFKI